MSDSQILQAIDEKRRFKRQIINESLALTVVLPGVTGAFKADLKDISIGGMKFTPPEDEMIQAGEIYPSRVYINNSIFVPLTFEVLRISEEEVAVQFCDCEPTAIEALWHFIQFLQKIEGYLELEKEQL